MTCIREIHENDEKRAAVNVYRKNDEIYCYVKSAHGIYNVDARNECNIYLYSLEENTIM